MNPYIKFKIIMAEYIILYYLKVFDIVCLIYIMGVSKPAHVDVLSIITMASNTKAELKVGESIFKLTAVLPFILRLLKWIIGGTLYHGIVRSVTGCRERAILRNENFPYTYYAYNWQDIYGIWGDLSQNSLARAS